LSEARFAAHEVAEQWTGQKRCEGIMLLFLATTAMHRAALCHVAALPLSAEPATVFVTVFFYLLAIVLRRSKRVIEQYDGVKISDVGQELAHN